MMVLGDVVTVKPGLFCLCHPLESVPVLLVQWHIPPTLYMVEDAKLRAHGAVLLGASRPQT
jgi:hypothetical protein